MPQFKVRDLMINILPTALPIGFGGCPNYCWNTVTCGGISCDVGSIACPGCTQWGTCPNNSILCTRWITNHGVVVLPQALDSLKAELRQILAGVEVQEKVMEERMRPQTLADIELLEQKMAAALEELKARKAELQSKPKDQG